MLSDSSFATGGYLVDPEVCMLIHTCCIHGSSKQTDNFCRLSFVMWHASRVVKIPLSVPIPKCIDVLWLSVWVCSHFAQNPIPAPGKPIPPSGTKFCGCQGDGVCGQLGQHCCCYDAKKDDISCQSDPVTSPAQCCGDPAKDCKKDESDVALPWL